MTTIFVAVLIFLLAIIGMALGIILRRDKTRGELKGSCGGPEINPNCCLKKNQECPKSCKNINNI